MRRARLRPALVAALAAAVIPAAIAAAAPSTNASSKPGARSAALSQTTAPVVTNASNSILSGGPIRGVILGAVGDNPEPLIADFPRLRALGVNLVSIYIYTYMDDYASSTVSRTGPHSMSDASLKVLTVAAHRAGLAVQYSPIIVLRNSLLWRGRIHPANISSWFYSYEKMINHYLGIAKQQKVEVFSIGSELYSLEIVWASRWQLLAARVNSKFSGLTTYMSEPAAMFNVNWWGSLDLISASMYYSLSGTPGPSVGSMVNTWQRSYLPALKTLSAKYNRPILFDEIGYASVVGAVIHPAISDREHRPPSLNEQANAYTALLVATQGSGSWLRGIVWWNYSNYAGMPGQHTGFSMKNKKAECVVAQHWSSHTLPQLAAAGMVPVLCLAANL
jgi:hypothetical protein